jgi:hypothetical protein
MLSKNKFLFSLMLFAALIITGCKKSKFVEINTDPQTLYDVPPEYQFLNATISAHNTDFEWFYDFYRRIMPWMQYSTPNAGNAKTFIEDAGNFNQRYGNYYTNVGNRLADIPRLIEAMPEEEQARRVYMKAIPNILFAHYTFYVSDINGSIPYHEAFRARYQGTLTPRYNTQQEIFNSLDSLLKATVAILKTPQPATSPQISLGNFDLYYGGDVSKWIKAANALRLRIAMRWMKRDPNKMKMIALEVLGSPASDLMSNIDDSWVLDVVPGFSEGGNWNPSGVFKATRPIVNFMLANADPRIRFFYQKNAFGQYVGSYTSPDAAANAANARLYTVVDTISEIMPRLFRPSTNGGTGVGNFPIITYADFAFMRAELAARAVTAENANMWYDSAVKVSIRLYDRWANAAKIQERNAAQTATSYVAVTDAEINNYLQMPGVKYDPARGVEYIAVQSYINFFKNPNEAWALYKRTGFPNSTSVLPLEKLFSDAIEQFVPRRAPIRVAPPTDLNYANNKAALDEMAKDPDFGAGPSDVTGRVWWDDK